MNACDGVHVGSWDAVDEDLTSHARLFEIPLITYVRTETNLAKYGNDRV